MADGIKTGIKLIKKFDRTDQFVKALNKELWNVIRTTARRIETRVKTTAPYRTGNLRRSYHFQHNRVELRAKVGSDPGVAPYAVYVEFGTSKQAAQPHLGPAGEDERQSFLLNLSTAMKRITRAWSAGDKR